MGSEEARDYVQCERSGNLTLIAIMGLQGAALLALSFGEKYKHTYGAHKAHKYRVGVLKLLCADTVKVFVVPVEGQQLLGSPSASFSGPRERYWTMLTDSNQSQSILWLCREGSFLSGQSKVCGCQTSPRKS